MVPASVPESCVALLTIALSTVSRSSVELTVWLTSPSARNAPAEWDRHTLHGVACRRINAVNRGVIVGLALRLNDRRHVGIAQLCGRPHQRIEHRLQIEGRAADDLEHVGSGGLLRQGLG